MEDKEKTSALINREVSGLSKLVNSFRERSRSKRIHLFKMHFHLGPETKILDLGGWDGSHVNALIEGAHLQRSNEFVADIDENAIQLAHARHGFTPVLIPEDGVLPFPDGFFRCGVLFIRARTCHRTEVSNMGYSIR